MAQSLPLCICKFQYFCKFESRCHKDYTRSRSQWYILGIRNPSSGHKEGNCSGK